MNLGDYSFSEQNGKTTVRIAIYNESPISMEKMIEMALIGGEAGLKKSDSESESENTRYFFLKTHSHSHFLSYNHEVMLSECQFMSH